MAKYQCKGCGAELERENVLVGVGTDKWDRWHYEETGNVSGPHQSPCGPVVEVEQTPTPIPTSIGNPGTEPGQRMIGEQPPPATVPELLERCRANSWPTGVAYEKSTQQRDVPHVMLPQRDFDAMAAKLQELSRPPADASVAELVERAGKTAARLQTAGSNKDADILIAMAAKLQELEQHLRQHARSLPPPDHRTDYGDGRASALHALGELLGVPDAVELREPRR